MNNEALSLAKERLRIPQLWVKLSLPGQPGNSCSVPWREDKHPSGSIYDDGRKFHDHATHEDFDGPAFLERARNISIGEAIQEFIKLAGVAPTTSGSGVPEQSVATYDYTDESGNVLFQVVRYEPKTFRQRRPDPATPGKWIWKLEGLRRVLYRLPQILAAVADEKEIFVVEGEKDADVLVEHGFAATCNAGGAGKWSDDYTATLHGADVVIIADKDEPGRNHAQLVAGKLHGCAKCVRVIELPDFNTKPVKDAHDFFAAGATAADLQQAIASAEPVAVNSSLYSNVTKPSKVSTAVTVLPEDDTDESLLKFPVDCLPPAMALMVRAVATTTRVPDALPGMMALALVAASTGKGLALDWRPGKATTPANLFIIASAASGSGKSESYKVLAAVFLAFERVMQEHWLKEIMPQLQADLRFHEGQLKKLDRKLTKESTKVEDMDRFRGEMKFHLAQVEELKSKLHEPQLSVQDATVEKVAVVMHHNDETIFSTSSDARKLCDNLLGRYSGGKLADDGIYLAGFSGDDVKVDRQGRDGVRLANPCLSLFWALQPDALDLLLDEQSLQQGGFLARCLLADTHAEPEHIGGDACSITDATIDRWEKLIRNLLITYRQPPVALAAKSATHEPEL